MRRKYFICGSAVALAALLIVFDCMPVGALRCTLLLSGYPAAVWSACTDVSDQAAEYVGLTSYKLDAKERLYTVTAPVPRDPATDTALDTWLVRRAGPFWLCHFSGKG